MMTARAMRQARLQSSKSEPTGDEERAKRSEVQQAIALGRGFAKRLSKVTDEYLSNNQEQYAALLEIAGQVNATLKAIRTTIGEPVQASPTESQQEEQAA